MKILQEKKYSSPEVCPYLKDKKGFIQEYFFAYDVNAEEYRKLLENSWRRFGIFYFRYVCKDCSECKPLRVEVKNFTPSKSQRKVIKKNRNTFVKIGNLNPSLEIYDIYKKHSKIKFKKDTDFSEFLRTFYYDVKFALQSEYYIDDKLVAIGFLDKVNNALSSVYFAYDTDYSEFSLGTFSVIKEIEYAKDSGLDYYYLGYYIKDNHSMSYKNRFKPNQILDKRKNIWIKI